MSKRHDSIYRLAACLVSALLLFACAKEDWGNKATQGALTPDGKVVLSFSAAVRTPDHIQTKASPGEEDEISNVYVLVFDNNDILSQAPSEAVSDGTKYKTTLSPNPAVQNIYALANLSAAQTAALGTLAAGTTSYADVRTALTTVDVTAAGMPVPFPMCSQVIQSAISVAMGAQTATMERVVARIDIDASTLSGTLFTLDSVTLLNGAKRGSVLPGATLSALSGSDVIRYDAQSAAGNRVTSAIYGYENGGTTDASAANPTRLLVKGTYKNCAPGYYLLHVVYRQAGDAVGTKRYDIRRNCTYTVQITGVDTPGYTTEAEALANKPTNDITYNVTVTEPDSHDIVSNGDYYLGLTNSDCLIFSSEEANNITLAVLTHSAPASVTTRSVAVSGTELTLIGNPLSVNADTPSPVVVNVGRNFSSGTITFQLGNLLKTINVERRENSLSFGGSLPLGPDYVLGEVLQTDPQAENWLKFTADIADGFATGSNKIVSTVGEEVYAVFEHNIITLDGTSRDKYEEAYLSNAHEAGRTKAIFYQHPYNMIKADGKPIPDTYVATFHRHDQVGERIISMANPSAGGLWIVEVVSGKDFINIAPGLNPNPDPNLYTENFNNAEAYPVEGNATQLVGTDNSITFRVGMKGTIGVDDNRYGLILVTHAMGSNRIFVRQGIAADYIMRESDPINPPASVTLSTRPMAAKFAPFNLTDPQGRTGRVDFSVDKADFTQYPSQGGYFFQAFKPYGWYPTARLATDWISNNNQVAGWQVCPEGYRHPMDGPDGTMTGTVIGSEMRQSLWYNPKNGNWSSDYENIIRGRLADGFYDRQQIKIPTAGEEYGTYGGGVTPKPSIVNSGATLGISGQVIFNPTTFASLFIPATGARAYNTGNLSNLGIDASLWSGTYTLASTWCASMVYWAGKYTFDNEITNNSNGLSIRCVKKRPEEI